MAGFWRGKGGKQRPAVSADFEHALTQEVLRSELIRVKALIATTLLLAAILLTVYFLAPDAVNAIWRGGLRPSYLYVTLVPFILFELWVHAAISRHLKRSGSSAGLRGAAGLFHFYHSLDAAARFLAFDFYRLCGSVRIVRHGHVLSSGRQR